MQQEENVEALIKDAEVATQQLVAVFGMPLVRALKEIADDAGFPVTLSIKVDPSKDHAGLVITFSKPDGEAH